MMNSDLRARVTLAYILLTALSMSFSYMMYTACLSEYNFGIAIAVFGIFNIILLNTYYLSIQRTLFRALGLSNKGKEENMSIKKAIGNNYPLLLLNGVMGALGLCCMLPFLTSVENAFLFILFGSFGRLIQVPLAQYFLNNKVEKKGLYYWGLIISIAGTVFYQTIGLENIGLGNDMIGLICATIYLATASCNSIIFTKITTKKHSGSRYVPVKTASTITVFIQVLIGLAIGVIVHIKSNDSMVSLIPTKNQFFALLLIGLLVPLFGTLASRLINILGHSIARAADGIRIVLGIILALFFAAFNGTLSHLLENGIPKLLGLCFVLIGVYISFLGKPKLTGEI